MNVAGWIIRSVLLAIAVIVFVPLGLAMTAVSLFRGTPDWLKEKT